MTADMDIGQIKGKLQELATCCVVVRCDNDSCNWTETVANLKAVAGMEGKVCPTCGEVVLTNEDAESARNLISMVEADLIPGRKSL